MILLSWRLYWPLNVLSHLSNSFSWILCFRFAMEPNAIGRLQEWTQKKKIPLPEYREMVSSDNLFRFSVSIEGTLEKSLFSLLVQICYNSWKHFYKTFLNWVNQSRPYFWKSSIGAISSISFCGLCSLQTSFLIASEGTLIWALFVFCKSLFYGFAFLPVDMN